MVRVLFRADLEVIQFASKFDMSLHGIALVFFFEGSRYSYSVPVVHPLFRSKWIEDAEGLVVGFDTLIPRFRFLGDRGAVQSLVYL